MALITKSLYDVEVGYYEYRPGLPLPSVHPPGGVYSCPREAVDAFLNMEIDEQNDTLFPTFMKTGQTWTLTIIRRIRMLEELEAGIDRPFSDYYNQNPYMETCSADGVSSVEKFKLLKPPRIMKTHLPFDLFQEKLKKHPNLKVLQTVRNPRDALVSFFHHLRSDSHFGAFNGTWDQFFEEFRNNRLAYGDFFKFNVEWYTFNRDRENSLVIKYEDMQKDTKAHVIKIAKFLGFGDLTEKQAQLIAEKSTVKVAGQKLNALFENIDQWDKKKSTFVRKGVVGDWKNYFSQEQCEYMDAKCKEYLEPLGLTFDYTI